MRHFKAFTTSTKSCYQHDFTEPDLRRFQYSKPKTNTTVQAGVSEKTNCTSPVRSLIFRIPIAMLQLLTKVHYHRMHHLPHFLFIPKRCWLWLAISRWEWQQSYPIHSSHRSINTGAVESTKGRRRRVDARLAFDGINQYPDHSQFPYSPFEEYVHSRKYGDASLRLAICISPTETATKVSTIPRISKSISLCLNLRFKLPSSIFQRNQQWLKKYKAVFSLRTKATFMQNSSWRS